MATPIWNDKEQRWTLRVTRYGSTKKFTSSKAGLAGKRAVLAKYREWENNGSTNRTKSTVAQVWDLFLEDVQQRNGYKSESFKQYESIGRLYILPRIGKAKINALIKNDYQKIINDAKPFNKNKETLSKKYLNNIRTTIITFLKYANENGYAEPFYGTLYLPKGHPTIGKEILQPDDIRTLFEPSDMHYHLAFCFMCVTGLRPGECLGLKWEDIDANSFTIRRSVTYDGELSPGKNANAQRTIPLHSITRSLLDQQRERTKDLYSEWVFCSPIGDMGNQHTLSNQLYQLGKERGFSVSPYCLRHTFISMVKNDMPEQMVKALAGHSEYMQTFETYGHIVDGELKKAAQITELVFKKATQEGT